MSTILTWLATIVIAIISTLSYGGVMLAMAIESACIPLPSEIVLPFAGFLVYRGEMNLWGVGLAGAVGCVLGSLVAYYVGAYGGRPLVEKYGRYVLLPRRDLDFADRWFERRGDIIIFIARLLPVIRTFIAFPAGMSRMPMGKFLIYTFAGSLIWCLLLTWFGMTLGRHWDTLGVYFHRFDYVIGILAVLGLAWYLFHRLRIVDWERN
jgi:membrane protein DedA with SNARE-associated domain